MEGLLETVYAAHNFEAENDDELTFKVGETVIVMQKDDGFNDGWWKGKNIRGEVGLFPMNYVTSQPFHQQQQLLPTPSTSDKTTKTNSRSSQHRLSQIDTKSTVISEQDDPSPSARSSYSFACPITTGRSSTSMSNHSATSLQTTANNNALRRSVINTLFLPNLRSTSPEEWDIDQVEVWLNAMNFGSIAANFKSQEITGDILLILNMEVLKELDVPTFGKRFKVHTAINVLREECGYQVIKSGNSRMSIVSSNCSDDTGFRHSSISPANISRTSKFRHSSISPTNISPTSRFSNPSCNRQCSYHSNLITTAADKHYRRTSQRASNSILKNGEDDEEDFVSIQSNIPTIDRNVSSNYDMMNVNSENYENDRFATPNQKIPNAKVDDVALIQAQKRQTVLPMTHRSSMDIYSTRTTDDNANVTPDMEGWLFKQGCKYKKWNKRWFVLKGPNLFYFKSPKDVRMKGIINLRGYRIIPDETIQPGKYSFKAQHEEERTFYFYTGLDTSMKSWISSLMKATISRDFTTPVLSSSVIPTVSLDVARRMRPRPPSVLLYRKENLKTVLSPQSYEASYGGYHSPVPEKSGAKSSSSSTSSNSNQSSNNKVTPENQQQEESQEDEEQLTNQDSGFDSDHQPINRDSIKDTANPEDEEDDEEEDETEPFIFEDQEDEGHFEQEGEEEEEQIEYQTENKPYTWTSSDYIQWVNTICTNSAKITTISELRQGEALIELLEELSGKKVKVLPPSTIGSISMLMLDNIVGVFKFMSVEGIEMEDKFTIKDIFGGKEEKMKIMLQSILDWSIQLNEEVK